MSHDQDAGGLTARHTPRGRKPGPQHEAGSLERPSLFAGMEEDDVDDVDADRVRLLSTLTSRGKDKARTGRSHGRGHAGALETLGASPWWGRSLSAAMALGAVVVLYSFVQVVRQPHAMSARARAAALAPSTPFAPGQSHPAAAVAADLNALPPTAAGADIASVHAAPASAEASAAASFQDVASMASAHIEVVPPVVLASPMTPPAAHSAAAPSASPKQAQTDRQAPHALQAPSALVARAAADAARLNAPASTVTPPTARPAPAREGGNRARANDDVALLEAMMKHASARRAPPSSMEALQSCASLQGAEAAVCKAKACVQHPTAQQCHGDSP